jgi:hypothetical protein
MTVRLFVLQSSKEHARLELSDFVMEFASRGVPLHALPPNRAAAVA